MRSNCVIFALALYMRRKRKGREGYLLIRRSRFGPFPHLLYAETRPTGHLRIVSYKPVEPEHKPVPPVIFAGRSRWGDFADTEVNR